MERAVAPGLWFWSTRIISGLRFSTGDNGTARTAGQEVLCSWIAKPRLHQKSQIRESVNVQQLGFKCAPKAKATPVSPRPQVALAAHASTLPSSRSAGFGKRSRRFLKPIRQNAAHSHPRRSSLPAPDLNLTLDKLDRLPKAIFCPELAP